MSAFTVPAVRAALVARHRAALTAAGLPDVAVTYGQPGPEIPSAFVAVSASDGVTRTVKRMPNRVTGSSDETYDLKVVLWVSTTGFTSDAQQAVTERVWSIAAVLEADLRTDPTLGGAVLTALYRSFDDDDYYLTEGRAAQLVGTVAVTAVRV